MVDEQEQRQLPREDKPPVGWGEPKRGRGRPVKESREERIYKFLVSTYGMLGMTITPINQMDGQIVMGQAEACARAHLEVGHIQPGYMRVLDILSGNYAYVMLFTTHAGIVMGIAANHGITRSNWAEKLGVKVPRKPDEEATEQVSTGGYESQSVWPSSTGIAGGFGEPQSGMSGTDSATPTATAITPELYAQIQAEADRQAAALRQQTASNGQGAQPNPTQNPAYLASLIGRRE